MVVFCRDEVLYNGGQHFSLYYELKNFFNPFLYQVFVSEYAFAVFMIQLALEPLLEN